MYNVHVPYFMAKPNYLKTFYVKNVTFSSLDTTGTLASTLASLDTRIILDSI